MGLLKSFSSIVIFFYIGFFMHVGMVHADQMDLFDKDFLIQRMRIAKIREFRGDIAAKALLASLVKEAKEIGVELPKWSCLKHLREVSQKNFRAREKVKPEKSELDEDSSAKDCHEKADKKVEPQEITGENDNQKEKKDKLSKDKDREFQRLSNIVKILKQADEVVDSLSY
ncbi:MAG: hypothetical protein IMF19_10850 [Proteobacteria bacterium]|nr:hypothetical protein [Pseudomonadota bacterium]